MRRDVEFPAVDVTLRGWIYTPDSGTGPFPTVVVAHGFTAVKEQSLDQLGEALAAAGVAALVYDHRCLGASDGLPRRHIDPWAQIRDYRHAISFAETLDEVASDRIGVWGTSYSGAHAIVVAAIDKRVKAGCSQVPMIAGLGMVQRHMDTMQKWYPLLDALDEDRRIWARGEEPSRICVVSQDPDVPHVLAGARSFNFFDHFKDKAPNWQNDITLRSIDLALEYDPRPFVELLNTTPYQFIISEDDLATPSDLQLEAYGRIRGPKELVVIPGDHYTSYLEYLPIAANAAADFFRRHLNRPMWDDARKKAIGG